MDAHAEGLRRPDSAIDVSNITNDSQQSDTYVLTRDTAASARLNLSHFIWLDAYGFNLHPTIAKAIVGRANLRVADIGTGTGIWLLDVAKTLPSSAQLDAIDISFSQCPPTAWLPYNVNLRHLDAFSDVPEHLHSHYDVIHIRHFVCVVKSDDPLPLLQNLCKMLKPGGYLQWDEWDVGRRNLIQAHAHAPREMIDKLEEEFKIMRKHTPMPTWPPRLDEYFLDVGLQDVAMEKRLSSNSHLPFMHDLTMLVFKELIDNAEASSSLGAEKCMELRRLLDGAIQESRAGAAWNLTRCMAIGRKHDSFRY
ncbi:hypothetical protein AMS68_001098 [Peltaster fructicola]|uniref:Methyltransferase domain-containing protein n=1 Tax=Peltaster fructicola TaxID=286661 RepID=A0A6H0XLR6_9PEZI|nr:hypothetical protein AMS68_001098 [Peltaster fructicola]